MRKRAGVKFGDENKKEPFVHYRLTVDKGSFIRQLVRRKTASIKRIEKRS